MGLHTRTSRERHELRRARGRLGRLAGWRHESPAAMMFSVASNPLEPISHGMIQTRAVGSSYTPLKSESDSESASASERQQQQHHCATKATTRRTSREAPSPDAHAQTWRATYADEQTHSSFPRLAQSLALVSPVGFRGAALANQREVSREQPTSGAARRAVSALTAQQ